MAEHRLSPAVNRRENLRYQKLITYRAADRPGAGPENGHQGSAGSVAIAGLGYAGLASEAAPDGADWDLAVAHMLHPRTDYSWANRCSRLLDGTYQFFGAAHRAVV